MEKELGAVAVGAYTEIVAIYGPSEALAGETVSLRVDIKNLHTGAIYIASLARVDGLDLTPTPEYATVDPGATQSFSYSFTMPQTDVIFEAWSYYWTGTEWYQDDSRRVSIRLKTLAAEFRGFEVTEYVAR